MSPMLLGNDIFAFREAHGIVGKLVSDCEQKGITLSKTKPLSQFSEKEWKGVVSLERGKLKKKVELDTKYEKTIKELVQKFKNVYNQL